jgi:hypothetical protein
VKPADILGIKKGIHERQNYEFAMNSKNKNIRYLYRGINEF